MTLWTLSSDIHNRLVPKTLLESRSDSLFGSRQTELQTFR
jgi:hypothetical protein